MQFKDIAKFCKKDSKLDDPILTALYRAGFYVQTSAGINTFMPLGQDTVDKIVRICKNAMYKHTNALTVNMPCLSPLSQLQTSKRLETLREILYIHDKYYLSPTHEETVSRIAQSFIKSYKDLPCHLMQFQTKFRKEIRPHGIFLRSREFLMQDSYSFDIDHTHANMAYEKTRQAYKSIFSELEIDYHIVQESAASMSGDYSEEFHVLSPMGQDTLALDVEGKAYKADNTLLNMQNKGALFTCAWRLENDITAKDITHVIQTWQKHDSYFATIVHSKNSVSLFKIGDAKPVSVTLDKVKVIYTDSGVIEAMQRKSSIHAKKDGLIIAISLNKDGDCKLISSDIRRANVGDYTLEGKEIKYLEKSIELAHIFKLGTYYSDLFNLKIQKADTVKKHPVIMGCYGIGIGRLLYTAFMKSKKDKLAWPKSIYKFPTLVLCAQDLEDFVKSMLAGVCNNSYELYVYRSGLSSILEKTKQCGYKKVIVCHKNHVTTITSSHTTQHTYQTLVSIL